MTAAEALARALHQAHWTALGVLHDPAAPDDATDFDLEPPSRRAYLQEQAHALLDAGWRPPEVTDGRA